MLPNLFPYCLLFFLIVFQSTGINRASDSPYKSYWLNDESGQCFGQGQLRVKNTHQFIPHIWSFSVTTTSPPVVATTKTCGTNEEFKSCGTACEPTCANLNPFCIAVCQENVCQCRFGFVRSTDGACVPVSTCGLTVSGKLTLYNWNWSLCLFMPFYQQNLLGWSSSELREFCRCGSPFFFFFSKFVLLLLKTYCIHDEKLARILMVFHDAVHMTSQALLLVHAQPISFMLTNHEYPLPVTCNTAIMSIQSLLGSCDGKLRRPSLTVLIGPWPSSYQPIPYSSFFSLFSHGAIEVCLCSMCCANLPAWSSSSDSGRRVLFHLSR